MKARAAYALSFLCLSSFVCIPSYTTKSFQPICEWDLLITPKEAQEQNCGNICPDFWSVPDNPHYCGPPSPCCCRPKCDHDLAEKRAFIGINWSDRFAQQPLPRSHQFDILKHNGFKHIKLFSSEGIADLVKTYGNNTGDVFIYLGATNIQTSDFAIHPEHAHSFVKYIVKPYQHLVQTIFAGNEPLICIQTEKWAENRECGALELPNKLLPAMKNLQKALVLENMTHISVNTVFNGGILSMSLNPWTPCMAEFRTSVQDLLRDVFEFLGEHNSPVVVNIYPWFAAHSGAIEVGLATGSTDKVSHDGQFSYYFNYDLQFDMMRIAMCKFGIGHLDVWIGETGWPSDGAALATRFTADTYIKNAFHRQNGTLIKTGDNDRSRFRGVATSMFLFEAFDERKKNKAHYGNLYENYFGLFTEDGVPKWMDKNGMLDLAIYGKQDSIKSLTDPLEPSYMYP